MPNTADCYPAATPVSDNSNDRRASLRSSNNRPLTSSAKLVHFLDTIGSSAGSSGTGSVQDRRRRSKGNSNICLTLVPDNQIPFLSLSDIIGTAERTGVTWSASSIPSSVYESVRSDETDQATSSGSSRRGSGSDVNDAPPFSVPRPHDRMAKQLWRAGSRAVQEPDGTVDLLQVADWLLTRKRGGNAKWKQLELTNKAIQKLRKETLDVERIYGKHLGVAGQARRKNDRNGLSKLIYLLKPQEKAKETVPTPKPKKRRRCSDDEVQMEKKEEPEKKRRRSLRNK